MLAQEESGRRQQMKSADQTMRQRQKCRDAQSQCEQISPLRPTLLDFQSQPGSETGTTPSLAERRGCRRPLPVQIPNQEPRREQANRIVRRIPKPETLRLKSTKRIILRRKQQLPREKNAGFEPESKSESNDRSAPWMRVLCQILMGLIMAPIYFVSVLFSSTPPWESSTASPLVKAPLIKHDYCGYHTPQSSNQGVWSVMDALWAWNSTP